MALFEHMDVTACRTVIIGSGCAGLNAAVSLSNLGETDLCILTDGLKRGTSRNAGSDKQTYYKLSLSGDQPDSVRAMARDLISEGVNGDTALVEAALSTQAFFHLVGLGVPFPTNRYGEFVGYQTDHDTRGRATSAGPLTSRMMTEALEREALQKKIPILDHVTAFSILLRDGGAAGVLGWDTVARRLKLVLAPHVVAATGGPASIYGSSVFPESQQGALGMLAETGADLSNLHQWQYGIASTKFRWNVSGSYQQALPRYISRDANGVEREFLADAFPGDPMRGVRYAFLKGYQWPFDVKKARESSLVDLLVQRECALGRRVYLDFTRNPSCLKDDFSNLDMEAREYLEKCECTQNTPIARLKHMNAPAVRLYQDHGIDLAHEALEIRVCAQHHNGGAAVDANWQTTVPGLYTVGEAAGTFGAYRPGGSALNATQVGSLRAAQHIAWDSERNCAADAGDLLEELRRGLSGLCFVGDPEAIAAEIRLKLSACGAHDRSIEGLMALDREIQQLLSDAVGELREIPEDFEARVRLRDQLVATRAVISAMLRAAEVFGSTGAGLVRGMDGQIIEHIEQAQNLVTITRRAERGFISHTTPARLIPDGAQWFETAWKEYRMRLSRKDRKTTDV